MTQTLLLVGGGHAHLHVLESLAAGGWPTIRTILVTPERRQLYSGMVPGYLAGHYRLEQLTIDLGELCREVGAELVEGSATRVDPVTRVATTSAGEIPFTLASVDVGSVPEGLELPGVRENALPLRPLSAVVGLRSRLDELARKSAAEGSEISIGVVGAGAAGVEVALTMSRRVRDVGGRAEITLVERGQEILAGYGSRARDTARVLLAKRGIRVMIDAEVAAVEAGAIRMIGDDPLRVDLVVWVGGASPPPLITDSPLPHGSGGYLAVERTLRAVDGSPVWGAGDCIDFAGRELAKSGVHAVREAPVLAANLRAALTGGAAKEYRPREVSLSLLNTADGRALLSWGGIVSHSRGAWWLKDRIDRRFVGRYTGWAEAGRGHPFQR